MLFIVLSGLLLSVLLIPFGKFFRSRWSVLLSALPIALFIYFLGYIPLVSSGNIIYESYKWVPSLRVDASFRLDGLSLLFSLLITGIGSLIFIYAHSYLKGHKYLDRFYGYLCLFMSAMLGLVLSDNIILLFIFWELTSISSFFLIGFTNDSAASRKSALTALSITGLGGFFLLAGLIIISQIAGTYQIGELLTSSDALTSHSLYPLILVLVFIGAFTKSAQFPFHFWLPGAMKAPTPVSAYLHSATMVKAGIFLLARFLPIIGGTEEWSYTLMIVGGFTMLYSAVHSLFRIDLKGVLAYSTISALGVLTFLIGIGTEGALVAMSAFIIVHALYKAALFLITGIIDHETGTRDITKLKGLRKVLFPLYIAGILASLSSAGVPLSFGFIGKDLIYEATLNIENQWAVYITILAVATNICLVAAGFMAGIKPFTGSLAPEYEKITLPYKSMWIPPVVLAVAGFIFGCYPAILDIVISPVLKSLTGVGVDVHLKIWHGFNTVLLLSVITLAVGTLIYFINKPSAVKLSAVERYNSLSPLAVYGRLTRFGFKFSEGYSQFMHNGFLRSYLITIIVFTEILLAYELIIGGPIYIDYSKLSAVTIYEAASVILLVAALYLTVTTRSRLTAVVATSVIGYALCLIFVFYSAPDLAITQFTIDTLVVVLFVFVLFKLPPFINFPGTNNRLIVVRDVVVALSFGTLLSLIAIKVLQVPTTTEVSDFYGEFAYTLAKGKNVVNVILVDFRGVDTMFEIVVLSIAALGVYSLIKLRLKPSEKE